MTNNPFYNMSINNRFPAEIEFKIAPETGPLPPQETVLQGNGKFVVTIIQPQDQVRHAVLGCFMDAWSKVEMQLARLLALAMSLQIDEMPPVMNALQARGQRELIEALLVPRLDEPTGAKLLDLLGRLKTNGTKRNYIVHGYWHLEVVVSDRNGVPWPNYRQFRKYDPSASSIRIALEQNQDRSARKTYMFSLSRIRRLSADLNAMWTELSLITENDLKQRAQQGVQLKITASPPITGVGA